MMLHRQRNIGQNSRIELRGCDGRVWSGRITAICISSAWLIAIPSCVSSLDHNWKAEEDLASQLDGLRHEFAARELHIANAFASVRETVHDDPYVLHSAFSQLIFKEFTEVALPDSS